LPVIESFIPRKPRIEYAGAIYHPTPPQATQGQV
jgi:hypothetical protein